MHDEVCVIFSYPAEEKLMLFLQSCTYVPFEPNEGSRASIRTMDAIDHTPVKKNKRTHLTMLVSKLIRQLGHAL